MSLTTFTPDVREIFRRLNILYSSYVRFSFINPDLISLIPRAFLTQRSPFTIQLASRDNCVQLYTPVESFHYSDYPEGCSFDELALGLVEAPFNLREHMERPPSYPTRVGFAYCGILNAPFSIPFRYRVRLTDVSHDSQGNEREILARVSLPTTFTIYRRDARTTWEEVLEYLIHLERSGSRDLLAHHVPPRYQTYISPMTPQTWHDLVQPFSAVRIFDNPDDYIIVHNEARLQVATHLAPKMFEIALRDIIASETHNVLMSLSTEEIIQLVQAETNMWFMDAEFYIEYFVAFQHLLFP